MTKISPKSSSNTSRHLHEISKIAPARPAGSAFEEKTKNYITKVLTDAGYSIERQPFKFPNIPVYYNEQFFDVLLIILAFLVMEIAPVFGFLLPFIFSILPVLMLEGVKLFPRKYFTENLIATPGKLQLSDSQLLIISHMDTARTMPYMSGIIGKFISYCQRYIFYVSFFVAIKSMALVLGITLPSAFVVSLYLFTIIIILTTFGYQIWIIFFRKEVFSPGANDNASGVACALATAEKVIQNQKKYPAKVSFLFTSAEEQGLFGANEFSGQDIHWEPKPDVINIDSIGSGNALGLVKRYGRLVPVAASNIMNSTLKELDKKLVDIIHIHRTGDYLPFLRAGYSAVSLESVLNGGTPPEYHTTMDTQEYINFDLLERADQLILSFISKLNSDEN